MSDVRVPREATEAAQKSLCDLPEDWTRNDWLADSWFCAQEMLEAALPFLRAQWEAERDRYAQALREIAEQDWVENALDPQWSARIARAALGSCVRSVKDDE